MEMIHCSNCQKLAGHKRALGFGTFLAVLFTAGVWLLFIPFYPKRCILCGQSGMDNKSQFAKWAPIGIILAAAAVIFLARLDPNSANTTLAPIIEGSPVHTSKASSGAIVPITYTIGQTLNVGYWSYRCNGAHWQDAIYSGYEPVESPDASFLVVDLTISNKDRTASTLPPVELVDEQGREYDESSKSIFVRGAFDTLKKLNPGVSSRGLILFDVPHGHYVLRLSGGFESGKNALVDLFSLSGEQKTVSGDNTSIDEPTAGLTKENAGSNPDGPAVSHNTTERVFQVGDGISAPVPIFIPDPDYSLEARQAKFQGSTTVAMIVDAEGHTRDVRVEQPLGLGLDQNIVDKLNTWRFEPAKKNGVPVTVSITVQIRFRIS